MGLSGPDFVGAGAGVDLDDFDGLGGLVLDGVGYVSPVTTDDLDINLPGPLAYTMFNAFLPILLEKRLGGMTPEPSTLLKPSAGIQPAGSSLEDSLWDVVTYSIGGCPGAIVSASTGMAVPNPTERLCHTARRLSRSIDLWPPVVPSGEHLLHRFLLRHLREGRRAPTIESEYGWDFFVLDYDVGDIVWVDSRDFLDKREGFCLWDCFCVIENVRSLSLPPSCDTRFFNLVF